MKLRKIGALFLSLAMALSLLAGCGGGSESASKSKGDESGRGDIISEEPGSDPGDTLDEPEVNFEDFFGCWEYADYDVWLYVYGDGTYEWYDSDGLDVMGNYYMSGDELCLEDSAMTFALDGSGGLVDSFGDTLFLSELPEW